MFEGFVYIYTYIYIISSFWCFLRIYIKLPAENGSNILLFFIA